MPRKKNSKRFRDKLDTITLPMADTTKSFEEANSLYEPILKELWVNTSRDMYVLRMDVADKIGDMQTEIRLDTMNRLLAGEFKNIEDVPLYRDEASGQVRNIPQEITPWFMFMAWLNETENKIYR